MTAPATTETAGTRLRVNGREYAVAVPGGTSLLAVLRNDLGLSGPKYGCGLAQCGACTVLVDGLPARPCTMTLDTLRGRAVVTLEGLAAGGALHPVQEAFIEGEGAQCGYCLNGMVMAIVALLARIADPSEAEIRAALRHHLCRCGSHLQILRSARLAAARLRTPPGTGRPTVTERSPG